MADAAISSGVPSGERIEILAILANTDGKEEGRDILGYIETK